MACHEQLLANGLTTDTPADELTTADEVPYTKGGSPLYIELHRHLFDSAEDAHDELNHFFADLTPVEIDSFLAMPPHEHLLYLLLHAYKHFVRSGIGLRQFCDIGLWARAYHAEIDWQRLHEQCESIHAATFAAAAFRIARDYLGIEFDLRAFGLDVWFDNAWSVRSQPPEETASGPSLFMQDAYRWLYEYRKLEALNARRDLRTITRESLMPYPAPWVFPEVRQRVFKTAHRRMLTGPDRLAYLRILTRGRHEAERYARTASARYLSFAVAWSGIMASLWEDRYLRAAILKTGEVAPILQKVTPADLSGGISADISGNLGGDL